MEAHVRLQCLAGHQAKCHSGVPEKARPILDIAVAVTLYLGSLTACKEAYRPSPSFARRDGRPLVHSC